jgi:hypothetical protein
MAPRRAEWLRASSRPRSGVVGQAFANPFERRRMTETPAQEKLFPVIGSLRRQYLRLTPTTEMLKTIIRLLNHNQRNRPSCA